MTMFGTVPCFPCLTIGLGLPRLRPTVFVSKKAVHIGGYLDLHAFANFQQDIHATEFDAKPAASDLEIHTIHM